MDEEELILQFKKYKQEMFLLALSIMGNYHDAEDVVAETMLKAYEKIGSLKSREKFKFWLMQILVNNARMMLRKNKHTFCVEDAEIKSDIPPNTSNVWEAVLSLEEELKTVVVLYYYQGFKINEIAKMTRVPSGTVKSRLSRSREKLKYLMR